MMQLYIIFLLASPSPVALKLNAPSLQAFQHCSTALLKCKIGGIPLKYITFNFSRDLKCFRKSYICFRKLATCAILAIIKNLFDILGNSVCECCE